MMPHFRKRGCDEKNKKIEKKHYSISIYMSGLDHEPYVFLPAIFAVSGDVIF